MANRVRLSKFLSVILRHRVHIFGISLDSQGFTDFDLVREIVEQRSKDNICLGNMCIFQQPWNGLKVLDSAV